MGKGGVNTMPQDGQHRRAILIRCKHCDKITTMDWEKTTADEFNGTMGVQKGCNSPLTAVSHKNRGTPHHKIKEALNRLKKEFGYGEKCKK